MAPAHGVEPQHPQRPLRRAHARECEGAEEQEQRLRDRIDNTVKRWKISGMDLESRSRWTDYSRAKDAMFEHTDTKEAPWVVVPSDDKRRARLNCMQHLLGSFDYQDVVPEPIALPPLQDDGGYVRPPVADQTFVPDCYPDRK
jgi:hypothetical protein